MTSTNAGASDARILAIQRPDPKLLWHYACLSLFGLVAAPIVFVPLFFKYHTLRYRLDEEGLSASWGILFRRETHLTYQRIQDIHVKRNIIERWLGIASVEVQTASGSSTAELALEGMRDWEAVRDFLYRRMRGHEMVVDGASAKASPETEVVELLRAIQAELEGTRRALEPLRVDPTRGDRT